MASIHLLSLLCAAGDEQRHSKIGKDQHVTSLQILQTVVQANVICWIVVALCHYM